MLDRKLTTTVLLGAGASVEAGVPASTDMTRRIAHEVDELHGRYRGTSQALNLAIGSMIAHDTAHGMNAFGGIDVERLFAAVQMLANRVDLEVSPFVTWNPGLESAEGPGRLGSFWARDFKRALASRFDSDLERAITDAIRSVTGANRDSSVFRALERDMISALQRAVSVDPGRVDYLAPLLNLSDGGAPARIATLNYDRSVELLSERAGGRLDTGVEGWDGGFGWSWKADAEVRLLKLHGSADWYITSGRPRGGHLRESRIFVDQGGHVERRVGGSLGVVFGRRGKLRAEGPFLAMLRGLDEFLRDSDHLLIVGYSLRDEHINSSLRRWFNACPSPRVTIVDPWLPEEGDRRSGSPFLRELLDTVEFGEQEGTETGRSVTYHPVRAHTSSALLDLLGAGPSLGTAQQPDPQTAS